MRPSWGLSTMVLFRESHLDSPDRSFVIIFVVLDVAFSCIGLILVTLHLTSCNFPFLLIKFEYLWFFFFLKKKRLSL